MKRILWAGILLTAVWAVCALRVNRAYPPAEGIQAGLNEPLDCGAYTVTLTEAYIAGTAALYAENNLSAQEPLPEKTLVCAVTIEANGDPPAPGQAEWFPAAVSGAWQNTVERGGLYRALNPASDRDTRAKQTYLLPFSLYRESFSPASWARLEEKIFALQFSLYPQRREVVFQVSGIPEALPPFAAGGRDACQTGRDMVS